MSAPGGAPRRRGAAAGGSAPRAARASRRATRCFSLGLCVAVQCSRIVRHTNSTSGHSSFRRASRPRQARSTTARGSSRRACGCCAARRGRPHRAASPAAVPPPPAVCRRRCALERRDRAPARALPHSRSDRRRRPTAVVSAAACSTSARPTTGCRRASALAAPVHFAWGRLCEGRRACVVSGAGAVGAGGCGALPTVVKRECVATVTRWAEKGAGGRAGGAHWPGRG